MRKLNGAVSVPNSPVQAKHSISITSLSKTSCIAKQRAVIENENILSCKIAVSFAVQFNFWLSKDSNNKGQKNSLYFSILILYLDNLQDISSDIDIRDKYSR